MCLVSEAKCISLSVTTICKLKGRKRKRERARDNG